MAASNRSSVSPKVIVVTVVYRSEAVLPGFLDSTRTASESDLEVIVADNKPGAGPTAAIVTGAGASYHPMNRNMGYGGAVNAIISKVRSDFDWILISNPDVVLRPGAIDTMIATAESDSDIAAVGPMILTVDGHVYPSARAVPSLRTGLGHALFANLWVSNPWTRAYLAERADVSSARETGWLSGACLLVRRRSFDEIGGFDEGYFMYFEDVDLGLRFAQAGYRNVYEPSAIVTHAGAHSTGSESEAMVRAHHDSAKRFLARKYAGLALWPVRFALSVGLSVRSAIVRRRLRRA